MNQTEQPTVDPAGNEAMGNTLSDVTTIPSAHQQLSQVGTRFVDRETNTSEVEVRPQREETRTDNIYIVTVEMYKGLLLMVVFLPMILTSLEAPQ